MKTHMKIAKGARKQNSPIARIEDALDAFREGRMIIVVDDEDRENEGDLTIAADKITPEAINFMAKYGRGLICLSMTPERLDELEIPLMVSQNTSRFETAFCIPIEAKGRTTTGISAQDRAATVQVAIDPATRPSDLLRPGHMFPLRARSGGVMERAGQTEAAVDLARIAGLYPAGVICEIMNEDGTMSRMPDLVKFAKKHDLLIITIADLIKYRIAHRDAGQEGGVGQAADGVRRELGDPRLRESARQEGARRACLWRHHRRAGTSSCASTPPASPATCCIRCVATAVSSAMRR